MATRSSNGSNSVKLPVVIVAALALIGFFVWLGYSYFGPPPSPPLNPAAQQISDQIHVLARKCQGDITKLSPEEQTKAQSLCNGNAKQLLPAYAKE